MSRAFVNLKPHTNRRQSIERFLPHVESLEDRTLLSADSYSFELLKTVGDPAPDDAGFFVFNFQVSGINNRGQVTVVGQLGTTNDPATAFGEGAFLLSRDHDKLLARAGDPAPGGGTFTLGSLGDTSLNDSGDVGISFILEPFSFPIGVNSGLYRYSRTDRTVHPVVVPDVTPAPGSDDPFAGVGFGSGLNNRGQLLFHGLVPSDAGVHIPGEEYIGLASGAYVADARGNISRAVVAGDPAPGGGTFDAVGDGQLNDRGDVAFTGHVAGECVTLVPQEIIINCFDGSVYVKQANTGDIQPIAEAGDPAPGGGVFHGVISPVINNRGDVVYRGGLVPTVPRDVVGVYRYSKGESIAIAKPGDSMPGGGTFVSSSLLGGSGQARINNRGDVAFNALLDPGVGSPESGPYVWSRGDVHLVAKTGTEIPGLGTIEQLATATAVFPEVPLGFTPDSGAYINEHGQIAFGATLSDGRVVLLVASPNRAPRAAIAAAAPAADAVFDGLFDDSNGSLIQLKGKETWNRAWTGAGRRVDHRVLESQHVDRVFRTTAFTDDRKADRPNPDALDQVIQK